MVNAAELKEWSLETQFCLIDTTLQSHPPTVCGNASMNLMVVKPPRKPPDVGLICDSWSKASRSDYMRCECFRGFGNAMESSGKDDMSFEQSCRDISIFSPASSDDNEAIGEASDLFGQSGFNREPEWGIKRLSSVSMQFLPDDGSRTVKIPSSNYELQYSFLTQRENDHDTLDKANQDSFCIHMPFRSNLNDHFFGVFVGHGEYGAQCSQFVKKKPCENLLKNTRFDANVTEACHSAFLSTNSLLHADHVDDCMSGTTTITVLVRWPSRWNVYLKMEGSRVHWFSIMNSLMVIFFLAGIVFVIFLRELHNFADDTVCFMKLDSDGNLRIYTSRKIGILRQHWAALSDQRLVFRYCGNMVICSYNDSGPVCKCTSQNFVPVDVKEGRRILNLGFDRLTVFDSTGSAEQFNRIRWSCKCADLYEIESFSSHQNLAILSLEWKRLSEVTKGMWGRTLHAFWMKGMIQDLVTSCAPILREHPFSNII